MDSFWSTAVPNWITALATVVALVLAGVGAWAAWKSLQSQLERDREEERNRIAGRAKTVTAQWVVRWRQPVGEDQEPYREWGILVTNHGTTPAFDIEIEAVAKNVACGIEQIAMLQRGELFLRRARDGTFSMKRMGTDIARVDVMSSGEWLVHGVKFVHDGETVAWRSRQLPTKEV